MIELQSLGWSQIEDILINITNPIKFARFGELERSSLCLYFNLLDCEVLTRNATLSALCVGIISEVYELESCSCTLIGALFKQITKPILVCLSYQIRNIL